MLFSHQPGFRAVLPSFAVACVHLGQEQLSNSVTIQAAFPSLLQLHTEACGDSGLALGTCVTRVCVMGQHLQLWSAPGPPWEGNAGQGGSCGKERCVTSKCCVLASSGRRPLQKSRWVSAAPCGWKSLLCLPAEGTARQEELRLRAARLFAQLLSLCQ